MAQEPIKPLDEILGLPATAEPVAPKPGNWRTQGAVSSRLNPVTNTIDFVENTGGSVRSWKQAYTPPPIDEKKSYAEALISDIPSRVSVMRRNLATGDIKAAEAERDQILKYAEENQEVLHRFALYRGRDPLAQKVAKTAIDVMTRGFLDEETMLLFDPKLNKASAMNDALNRGLSPAATQFLSASRYGEGPAAAEAAEVLRYGDEQVAPTRAQRMPDGTIVPVQTPGRSLNDWADYYRDSSAKLSSNLPESVLGLMSPSAKVRLMRMGFEGGDRESGGAILGMATKAVNEADGLDDRGKANLFESTLQTAVEGRKAWGRTDDPVWSARGAKVMESLQSILPGGRMAEQRREVAGALGEVSNTIERVGSFGRTLSDQGASRLARVQLASSLNLDSNLAPEEQALKAKLGGLRVLSSNIRVNPDWQIPKAMQAATEKKTVAIPGSDQQINLAMGYRMQKSAIDTVFDLASADMAETGADQQTAITRSIKPLSDALLAQGATSQKTADATAKFMMRHLMESGGGDLSSIAQEVRIKRGEIAQMERDALGKPPTDVGAGLPRRAAAEARAKIASEIDRGVYTALSKAQVGADDIRPGEGEWNVLRTAMRKSTEPLADSLVSTGSDIYKVLADAPASTLGDPAVRKRAIDAFVAQAKATAPKTAAALSDAEWSAIGAQVADKVANGIAAKFKGQTTGVGISYREALGATEVGEEALTLAPNQLDKMGFISGRAPTEAEKFSTMSAKDYAKAAISGALSAAILGKAVGGLRGGAQAGGVALAAGLPAAAASSSVLATIGATTASNAATLSAAQAAYAAGVTGALEAGASYTGGAFAAPAMAVVPSVALALPAAAAAGSLGALAYMAGLDKVQPADSTNLAVKAKLYADQVFMGPETPEPAATLSPAAQTPTTAADVQGVMSPFGPGSVMANPRLAVLPKAPGYGDLFLDPDFKIEDVLATLDTVKSHSRAAVESEMENDLVFKHLPERLDRESMAKRMELQNAYFNAKTTGQIKSFGEARSFLIRNISAIEKATEQSKLDYLAQQLELKKKSKGDTADDDPFTVKETSVDQK